MQQNIAKYTVNIVRHAESEFNLAQFNHGGDKAVSHDGFHAECPNIKFDPKYFDAGITEKGFEQCKRGHTDVKDRNVKLVIVSPLKRALETCAEVFKGHKNQPKIIVNPLFREMCLSSCDIGSLILENQKEFPDFDFEFIKQYENPLLWAFYEISDKQYVQQLLQQIKTECQDEQGFQQNGHLKLLEIMKNMFPQKQLEKQQDTNERSRRQREYIRQIAQQYNIQEGEEIAVVGHSRNLQAFSCTEFAEDGSVINGTWLENCEVKQIEI